MKNHEIAYSAHLIAANEIDNRELSDPDGALAFELGEFLIRHSDEWAGDDLDDDRYETVIDRYFAN